MKVQSSKSPWNPPLLLVLKKSSKDGEKKWRLVVDFRKLNYVTIKQVFPIPRSEEILDQLGYCKYFSTLALESGYQRVLIEPKNCEKTAFSTELGHFEFKRMSFGLTRMPAMLQRIMNRVTRH